MKEYPICPDCGKKITNFNKGTHCYYCGTEYCKKCSGDYILYECEYCPPDDEDYNE